MTTKHTPGPWIANNATVHTEQGLLVAQVMGTPERNRNSAHANARLMAVAPEMFEACEELIAESDNGFHNAGTAAFYMLRAALAKARS